MRKIKVVVMFFLLWTPLQMSLAIHFLNPIGLLVFFLLICKNSLHIKAFCCCSVTQSGSTIYDPIDRSMWGFPVLHHILELAQTHVHWVSDAIQPSHPLCPFSSCPQSFPASGSFPMSQFFISGGQSIGASVSASVPPMNNSWLITLQIFVYMLLFAFCFTNELSSVWMLLYRMNTNLL